MKINNIDFDITKVEIENVCNPIGSFRNTHFANAIEASIKINATTSNSNLFALDKWFSKMSLSVPVSSYKFDIIYNSVQIYGIFPRDYTFNQYNIEVIFSADYIIGNLQLFNKQKLRKEKLKKIESYANKKW